LKQLNGIEKEQIEAILAKKEALENAEFM